MALNINKYKESLITQEELKELLIYEPETGYFFWLQPKQGRPKDKPAGYKTTGGYYTLVINGVKFSSHRLAWFYMTGNWPKEYIDHKDGDPGNNKWNNLREATAQQNSQNKKRKYGSASGIKGVVKNYMNDTWEVHMNCNGKVISRGPYYSYQLACREYDRIAKENFGEFARKEPIRQQKAKFTNKEVNEAVKEFIRNKKLVNGIYID